MSTLSVTTTISTHSVTTMNKVFTLISLQLKLKWGRDKKTDEKGAAISIIIGIITAAILLALLKVFLDILIVNGSNGIDKQKFSMFLLAPIGVILTVIGIVFQIKYLLKPFDVAITARFPVSSFQLLLANVFIIYLYMQLYSFLLVLPLMIVYGLSAELLTFNFFVSMVILAFFAPMIPFAISTILAIPVMFVLRLLENHNIVKLSIFIVLLSAVFIGYNYLLSFLADFYITQRVDSAATNFLDMIVVSLNNKFDIFVCFKDILFNQNVGRAIGMIVGILVGGSTIGLLMAKIEYKNITTKALEGSKKIFNKKVKMNSDSAFVAIFKKECKDIIRTNTYTFFYLGIAITTPVMVFLCNRLVDKVGKAQLGELVSFGIALIVLLIFLSMINSFSASVISREDKKFYITKIVPIDYRLQLCAKGFLNLIVSLGAVFISCTILSTLKFVTTLQMIIIVVLSIVFTVGLITNGFNINLAHPNVQSKLNGEINELNVTKMLLVGGLVSAVIGFLAIVLIYIIPIGLVYLTVSSIAVIYTAVNVVVFSTTAKKRYWKIEN